MKTVKLTPEQDKEWEKIFEISLNNGASEKKADKEAFEHICSFWPELKKTNKLAIKVKKSNPKAFKNLNKFHGFFDTSNDID